MRVLLACVVLLAMVCSASAIQWIGYQNSDCTGRSAAIFTAEAGVCTTSFTGQYAIYTCDGSDVKEEIFNTDSTCNAANSTGPASLKEVGCHPADGEGSTLWSCEDKASASSITVSAVMVAALAAVAAFIKF